MMRWFIRLALSVVALGFAVPAPVVAQGSGYELGIAAIVNDEVISNFDVEQRLRLLVSSSGVKPSEDELKRLQAQVLRQLIDEKLQWQETRKFEVEVGEDEIIDQLSYIAQRSGVKVDDIAGQLAKDGISIYTLTDQIKVDIAWNKLVRGRFSPQVRVSEDEIDRILDEARANYDKPQYRVVEIFLPVDSPADERRVEAEALGLVAQMGKGVPFPQIAEQFSQAPSAASGGDIGWVTRGQLPQAIDDWLAGAHRGSLTAKPIRTVGGYYLIGVIDTRNVASQPTSPDTPLYLKRVEIPISNSLDFDKAVERGKWAFTQLAGLAKRVNGCNTLEAEVAKVPGARVVDLGTKTFKQLADQDKARVGGLVSGQASDQPFRSNIGADIIVLCGHAEEQSQGLPSRDEITERLYGQQISMLQRRYLRDLRRDAVIETRLGDPNGS